MAQSMLPRGVTWLQQERQHQGVAQQAWGHQPGQAWLHWQMELQQRLAQERLLGEVQQASGRHSLWQTAWQPMPQGEGQLA